MNKRDFQRILRIDEEIHLLTINYESMRQSELLNGKTTLLLSRGIKHRLDTMVRARIALAKSMAVAPTRSKVFNDELAERKRRLDDAHAELPILAQTLLGAIAEFRADNNPQTKLAMKEAEFEVRRQKSRIAAYERSYVAFSKREKTLPIRLSRSILPKGYKPEEDAAAIYGNMPIDNTIAAAVTQPRRVEDTTLGQTEAFKDNRKAVNNASLDLLSRPPETLPMLGGWGGDTDTNPIIEPQRKRFTIDFE